MNKKRKTEKVLSNFGDMYFNHDSIYDEAKHERRFRMQCFLFDCIYKCIYAQYFSLTFSASLGLAL